MRTVQEADSSEVSEVCAAITLVGVPEVGVVLKLTTDAAETLEGSLVGGGGFTIFEAR